MTTNNVPNLSTLVNELTDDSFKHAVVQAAASMEKPEYNGRLGKAIDFVLSGAVTLYEDGTATVKSGTHTYEILHECTCEDSRRRSLYCKHFLAVQLLKRTLEQQSTGNGESRQGYTPPASDYEEATRGRHSRKPRTSRKRRRPAA